MVYYIERKFHKFPLSLLNEIRDVFDHISRCYEPDAKPEYIDDNIKKAEKTESKNIKQAYDLFYQSAEKYNEIDDLIRQKRESIVKAKFQYRKVTFCNHIIGFILGVVNSIIANNINMIHNIKSWFVDFFK